MHSCALLIRVSALVLCFSLSTASSVFATTESLLVDNAYWPSWSPDATEIAFNRNDVGAIGFVEIWKVTSTGGDPELMVVDPLGANAPIWMPDGRHILYSQVRFDLPGSPAEFVIHNLDGGDPVTWQVDLFDTEYGYSLSPGGTEVLYTGSNSDLWALNLATGSVRLVKNDCVCAVISPDGLQLAYTNDAGTVCIEPIGGGPVQVFEAGYLIDWTPDSAYLAFSGFDVAGPQNLDLMLLKVDGSLRQQLTSGPELDWYLDVSPDGTQIAFTRSEHELGPAAIWLIDLVLTPVAPTSWGAIKASFR